MKNLFKQLFQVAAGGRERLDKTPSDDEWEEIFEETLKQSVAGYLFTAVEKLSDCGQKPPLELLYQWIGTVENIKQQNYLHNQRIIELSEKFGELGIETCLLKGQGNANMYPKPYLRTPGDIDIWINDSKHNIINNVRREFPGAYASDHHIDYPIFDDVPVEVHYVPTFSTSPRFQRKLDMFIEEQRMEQFNAQPTLLFGTSIGVHTPTKDFNVIFQLTHMQRHFFFEGIGMRHILDYYYLLLSLNKIQLNRAKCKLKNLGLEKFTSAIMWVLSEYMNLDKEYMITEPDKNRGKIIEKEMMIGGNFGHYDGRVTKILSKYSTTLSVIAHNLRLFRYFPEESVALPLTNIKRNFFEKC